MNCKSKGLSTVMIVGLVLFASAFASCGTLLFVKPTGHESSTSSSVLLVPLNSTVQLKVLHVGDSLGSDYIITGITGSSLTSNLIITNAQTKVSFSPKVLYVATFKEFQAILSGTLGTSMLGTSFRLYGRLYNAYYNDGIGICIISVAGV